MEHEGEPAILADLLDITDRVRAEERDRLLSTMLDAAPAAIIVTAPTGELLFANNTASELHGTPMDQLLARSALDLVAPDDVHGLAAAVEHVLEDGSYAFDTRIARADGSLVHTQVSAKSVDWYGQPAVLCVVTDLTSHLRGEAERERLSTAVDHAGEAIVITDAAGLIQYVNPAFETVSGYSRAEALGQNPRILSSGKQAPEFYRNLWETITSGRNWHGQLVNRHRDGREYTEDATISPVRDPDGNIVAFVAVKRDITEELRTRSELSQAQRLEAVGRLAGGVAHDFNNLLVVVLGYTDFAIQALADDDPVRLDLEQARGAAERATTLTRQLLAFSRRQHLVREVFDLNHVLSNLERMLQRIVGEDVDLSVHTAEGPCMIQGDPGRLEQVVMNLVVNAKDAMPQGGRLNIETRCLAPENAPPLPDLSTPVAQVVELSVSDSGHGMDEATLEMVFEPFFTTKELGKGTGLGLSTVYGIIKQTGGEIRVESQVGLGTTFRVFLPTTEEAPTPLQTSTATPISDATETILLVEDDEQVRRLAERALRHAGYRVLAAASGGDAIVLWEKESRPIHLLLTDVVMPHMSGPDLASRLREMDPTLKVIFMSGYTDDRLRDYGPSGVAASVLAKPFSPDGLRARVRSTLEA